MQGAPPTLLHPPSQLPAPGFLPGTPELPGEATVQLEPSNSTTATRGDVVALSYLLPPGPPLAPQLSTSHPNTELPKTSARDTPPRTDVRPPVSSCQSHYIGLSSCYRTDGFWVFGEKRMRDVGAHAPRALHAAYDPPSTRSGQGLLTAPPTEGRTEEAAEMKASCCYRSLKAWFNVANADIIS